MDATQGAFRDACKQIEGAYKRLGHKIGWRFLNSPQSRLSSSTPIALITMNPGGAIERPDHARESSEKGSAYLIEAWGRGYPPGEAPLQLQIRRLFEMLAAARGQVGSGDELLEQSLAAYFVPFRSPTFKALVQPSESLAFAQALWTGLFNTLDPRLIITIDRRTTRALKRILGEKLGATPSYDQYPVGWGNYTADLISFKSADHGRAILRFPHLSRFKVFGRAESEADLKRIMRTVASRVL